MWLIQGEIRLARRSVDPISGLAGIERIHTGEHRIEIGLSSTDRGGALSGRHGECVCIYARRRCSKKTETVQLAISRIIKRDVKLSTIRYIVIR